MNLRLLVAFLLVISVCFVVFSSTIGYEFVNWDDDIYVYDNTKIRSLAVEDAGWWFSHTYYYAYIPLTMLSHSLDYLFWGLSPRGHHLTNVILHSMNAGWIFLLGMVVVRRRRAWVDRDSIAQASPNNWAVLPGMAVAALLFAVHPLRVESVAWVSDRKDLLCVFFLVPSATFYLLSTANKEAQRGKVFLFLSFFLYLCSVLSKSVAIGFPLVLLALDWYLLPSSEWKEQRKALLTSKLWYFAVSVAIALVLLTISSGGKRAYAVEQLQGIEVILFPLYGFALYLYKTILPLDLSPIYPAVDTGSLAIGTMMFVVITVATVLAARRGRKEFLLSWIAYLVFLFPTVAGLSSGMQPQADRFSYLPMIGIFLCLGGGLAALPQLGSAFGRLLLPVVALVLIALLGSLSVRQSERWQSSETLWSYVVESFPPAPDYMDAYVNLGAVYASRMELPDAERVLSTAVMMDSSSADAVYNLGHVLYLRGEWEQAAGHFERTTRIDSSYARAYYNYAIVTSQLGRDTLAIPAMRRAARLGMQEAIVALQQSGIPLEEEAGTLPAE